MDLLPDRCAQPRQRWNALGMEVELPLLSPFSAMSLSSLLYTKRRTPVGRKARNELQMAVNNCFLPMALICTSSENNGLWPGLYTHSLNEAGCLGWDVSELRTQEPTFARHSSSCMLVCVRPSQPWPSRRRVVDGTDHVGAPEKPFASWWSGPGRTGALHRRLCRSGGAEVTLPNPRIG